MIITEPKGRFMEKKKDLALQSVQSYIVEIRGVQVILDAELPLYMEWKQRG